MRVLALALTLTALAGSASAADNRLSRAERQAGWVSLFDGRTTKGWHGYNRVGAAPGWQVRDGALFPDPKVPGDIVTRRNFANFELSLEWRISPGGNSGVMFHVLPQGQETYESGPEYQILDNARRSLPKEKAGGLYALVAPSVDATRPVGQFNQARLIVDHGKVEHWLNGVKVAAYQIGTPEFAAMVAASKFRQWPPFATGQTGAIALQNHGDDVAFKNVKVRVLK